MAQLELKGSKDPPLLEALHNLDPDCVLVTSDDAMPATHKAELGRFRTTVAVVAPWEPSSGLIEPQWEHEIVQKWAHLMEGQTSGTVYRYTLQGRRKWTFRKRPPRFA